MELLFLLILQWIVLSVLEYLTVSVELQNKLKDAGCDSYSLFKVIPLSSFLH